MTKPEDLSKPGTEQFYSLKIHEHGFRIIVNGREKSWEEKTISYDQVVKLAYENYVESNDVVYTVDYVDGPPKNTEGSMVKGYVVSVKNKMIFNVTATNRS
jgi:Multiubiquitin